MSLRIDGHKIYRSGEKIGWVDGHTLYTEDGNKIGYWDDSHVYDMKGRRVVSIHGNRLVTPNGDDDAHLDDAIEHIPSATLSEIARVAIKTFFGD